MNKKLILLSCIVICIILVACGSSMTAEENVTQVSNVAEEEINEVENIINKVDDSSKNESKTEEEENDTLEFQICNYGDTITTEFVEMTIENSSILENIYPSDTSGAYSYKPDQDGEQYFCLIGSIKNIGGNSYDVEDMYIEMIFDNKYTYTGYVAADDGGNDFFGNNVKPLATVKFYLYSSIPDELINSYSTCTIKFAFKESFEHDYHSDFSLYDYRYQIELEKNNSNNTVGEDTEISETEKSDIDDADLIDGNYIADLLEKYPEYVNELSNYVTSIHRLDFANGKSFSDFDDYDEYFKDFCDWANEIIDYKGEVASEYQELWKEFQSLIIYHVDVLDESYNKDNKEALTLISQLMDYISDKPKVISQLISDLK